MNGVITSSMIVKMIYCPYKDLTHNIQSNIPLRLQEFPRALPSGTPSCKGVYLIVYISYIDGFIVIQSDKHCSIISNVEGDTGSFFTPTGKLDTQNQTWKDYTIKTMPDFVLRVTVLVLSAVWRFRLRIMLGTALLKYLADLQFSSRYVFLFLVFTTEVFLGNRCRCCGLAEDLSANLLHVCSLKSSKLGILTRVLAW